MMPDRTIRESLTPINCPLAYVTAVAPTWTLRATQLVPSDERYRDNPVSATN